MGNFQGGGNRGGFRGNEFGLSFDDFVHNLANGFELEETIVSFPGVR